MTEKIEIEYIIRAIVDSNKKGNVDVLMEPADSTGYEEQPMEGSVMVNPNVPDGFPVELVQMLQQIPHQMMKMSGRNTGRNDGLNPRSILYMENAIDFKSRNWHHGDKIRVSFDKILE